MSPRLAHLAASAPSTPRSRRRTRLYELLGALAVASCAEPADSSTSDASTGSVDVPEDESALIAADLCEHASEGPFKPLAATTDASTAPEAYVSHTLLTVTGSGDAAHFLKLSVSDAGEHVVGTIGVTGLTITDAAGTAVTIDEEEAVTACEGIETAHHVTLGIGTYAVAFELTGAEAGFVILTGEHEEDDAK